MKAYIAGSNISEAVRAWAQGEGFEAAHCCDVGGVAVLIGPSDFQVDCDREGWLNDQGYDRIFESCFVCATLSAESRTEVVRELFQRIGPREYCASINPLQNASCYGELFAFAKKISEREILSLFDLGCGPGTILDSHVSRCGLNITGFDLAEDNLKAASARGLNVIDENGLSEYGPSQFDAVICAYVMHYESMSSIFVARVFDLIKPGGVWVSNFHKRKGLENFLALIDSMGSKEIILRESQFGPLVAVVRVD
ncbi:class I SAM-dependent methyltransferase [Burkholderia gladioli]|uniref:class I SAM-dependent methyltransferase n=1 Tax=Burkholderia gladioli TaxID=28095 RepID=UPI0016417CE3|nr:methyltransferase domain-containing protein [Burkholderia gladioli]